jgi:hypothetical protein
LNRTIEWDKLVMPRHSGRVIWSVLCLGDQTDMLFEKA